MNLNKIYTSDDLYSRSDKYKERTTLFLNKLTDLGKFIKDKGTEIDITMSTLGRKKYVFETKHQKITLQENSFYDDIDRLFVVTYVSEFQNIVDIQETEINGLKKKMEFYKVAVLVLLIFPAIFLISKFY